ncbi:hypothetical protein [Streptacidiphilus carbonis]|uniref:hypothetical protein n=1 Tax=Streptacidiphilus carbonis TaxID=105422 RepID=UPI000AD3465C|nr:hypothetical protein [Streptacidiphilus carbonis]
MTTILAAVPAARTPHLSAGDELLRRVIDTQIGPRIEGTIYENTDGAFLVLEVVRDPQRARELLGRRSAQWALVVRDVLRHDGEPFAVGSVWTSADHLVSGGSR